MSDETQAAIAETTVENIIRVIEQALRDMVIETALAAGVSASRVEAIGRGEVPTSNELDDLAAGFVGLIGRARRGGVAAS
jgi:hypothetical protein